MSTSAMTGRGRSESLRVGESRCVVACCELRGQRMARLRQKLLGKHTRLEIRSRPKRVESWRGGANGHRDLDGGRPLDLLDCKRP